MSILFYNRPDYVTKHDGPLNASECQRYIEKARCSRAVIPPNLSFDNIVEGKSRPPCSLPDFMDYLVYISHDAENLQFYLWLQDYTKRFDALPMSEKSRSPNWLVNDTPPNLRRAPKSEPSSKSLSTDASLRKDSASHVSEVEIDDLRTASELSSTDNTNSLSGLISNHGDEADARRTRYDSQPFRGEVHQILTHYIYTDAPRELNISHRTRSEILLAVQHTTHPSAFSSVVPAITLTLRNQSHPNFIRWSVCNGNKPRVFFLRTMVTVLLCLGTLPALFLSLSGMSRWWRILVWPVWMSAITGIVATYQGLCIILSNAHSRQAHPWELDETDGFNFNHAMSSSSAGIVQDCEAARQYPTSVNCSSNRMEPFGYDNTYEHENWIRSWAMQSWWRKVWGKTVWVQEEGLKIIQDRIVKQSFAWGAIISILAIVALVALPAGRLY